MHPPFASQNTRREYYRVHCLAFLICILCSASLFAQTSGDSPKPMKAFILAGQSNMQGHARVATLDYIKDDPQTAEWYQKIIRADGSAIQHDAIRISYLTGNREADFAIDGPLTTGFGARRSVEESGVQESDLKIGPELTFGITVHEQLGEPVLLIKTAWGGKSLYYDFRPPSAGVYPRSKDDIEKDRHPEDRSGHYYRLMIKHVQEVLSDPKQVHPQFDSDAGYEVAGFVWFQGWNDMVNRGVYPQKPDPQKLAEQDQNRFVKYSDWMADFIRNVRRDLDAPRMPFVIGVMGVGGDQPNEGNAQFRAAMAAPASLPEFQGNVLAVPTATFWDADLAAIDAKRGQVRQMGYYLRTKHKNHANADGKMTKQDQQAYLAKFEEDLITPAEKDLWQRGASNAGYHYLGCGKTFVRMGTAFAEAILSMQSQRSDGKSPLSLAPFRN